MKEYFTTSKHAKFYSWFYLTDKLPENKCKYYKKLAIAVLLSVFVFVAEKIGKWGIPLYNKLPSYIFGKLDRGFKDDYRDFGYITVFFLWLLYLAALAANAIFTSEPFDSLGEKIGLAFFMAFVACLIVFLIRLPRMRLFHLYEIHKITWEEFEIRDKNRFKFWKWFTTKKTFDAIENWWKSFKDKTCTKIKWINPYKQEEDNK